ALLLAGKFARGWAGYETRLRIEKDGVPPRPYAQLRWDGRSEVRGKRILLYPEQGLGDTIQFSLYATVLAERGAHVLLEVQPPLCAVLGTLAGVGTVFASGAAMPPFDLHAPLLSLPLALGTTLDTIPAKTPYIAADADKVAAWASRLGPRTRPRLGIAWSGSATHKNDRFRSARLADFAALGAGSIEIISLQKELPAHDAAAARTLRIAHFGDKLGDFSDTAALVANVDLVVSVDTSAAHLAGALGKEVWILLPFRGLDWRWLADRADSPWYPTARLFRQERDEPWSSVLARVAHEARRRFHF
ncbi:MAG: hypothetical protein RL477_770, partial [Pseudomonadota bacterium]